MEAENRAYLRIYLTIGMATRARMLVSGDESCERTIKAGKGKFCVIAEDASENTKKKFTNMCKFRNIDLAIWGNKEDLGKYTGKNIRTVAVITDSGFSGKIKELIGK